MEAALLKIKGVKKAKASKEKSNAAVTYDAKQTTLYNIVKTFNDTNGGGYKAALPKK